MSDSISVILLIGAAVVGPIEAQMTQTSYFPMRFQQETFSQLCERAMREIGAIDWADGAKILPRRPTVSGTSLEGSPEVFCIPTPKGYAK